MRLFLFLVGGTGSRVLRPLIMQFAAGVHPKDENGADMPLEVVPIVIDPHKANEDVKRTDNLLRWYKQIHQALYAHEAKPTHGFFSVKISTLADVSPNGTELADTFQMRLGTMESATFRNFLDYNTLDTANQALCSMMFADYQLETKMDIGFVGNPNIGSVALNELKDSEEFKQFSNVFQHGDRIFIVSSIFGGTGAAGYPVIVNNIRNADQNPNINNRGDLRDSRIGALTVLPYFNVQQDEHSPISRADFISKTKSALYYYHDNLTGLRQDGQDLPLSKVNACYYLGDEIPSTPYFNDPGGNGQRNDAHLVEFVGALAILDFLQTPDDQLTTNNGKAVRPIFKEYGLAADTRNVTLKDLGLQTRVNLNEQMSKFHLAYMYITHQLREDIGRGYTHDKPEISKGFLSTSFFTTLTANFFVAYVQWLKELKGNQRSFAPFNLDTQELRNCLNSISPKSGFLKSVISYKTMLSALNTASQKATRQNAFSQTGVASKLMSLLDTATEQMIGKKYDSVI